ncbi:16S rRNA (guanine527-N7)-methyltransferase [Butyrivibrio hungatei DSM 14810]|uniref:Ribosomal RNA small subunit methyltransferase G n=1 Tax=Butyrivibrio hungatei DSM 14810 TaxID=1121132 RepID=A0A1M7SQU1_9FIRM|nr:16S rRNA (guanine(527)-N(7))-methyltransferase RsmG [Butyrivibrio hungatei]SHN60841.1 16S rRNA (guanine527-N7)-methyltransferase [Butyrivibrio hungatei DSM 14810]
MRNKYELMLKDFSDLGIELSDKQLDQFNKYYELLIKWNEVMNLTAITEFQDVCKLHFVDSVSSCKYFDFNKSDFSLIDVGTGAGFPSVPLKIVFPHLNMTLLDSLNKRLNFLNEVIDELGLNSEGSIKTLHGRAEDYSSAKSDSLRETFDISVSRAVANMSTLSEYCLPYVKVGGTFIAYKSEKAADELNAAKGAIHLLGGKLLSANEFMLPNSDISRTICLVEKKENTSKKYPRKAGVPSKQPL